MNSSSSSRAHFIVGSLRQNTKCSSSQFWHGLRLVSMALLSLLTQSIHLCFGLPRFLLPGGTISIVFRPTYSWSRLFTCPNLLSVAFLHHSVLFSTYSISLPGVIISRLSLGVWPQAHIHISISDTSSFFTWELVIGIVSIPYSIAG